MSFRTYHPVVNFIYLVFVIGFTCWFQHPVCLAVTFFSSLAYAMVLDGNFKKRLSLTLTVLLITSFINPLFNHRGVTVLFYFPGGNPATLESVVYGLSTAVMLVSVINWFVCFNSLITGDKLMYLFGKVSPAFSLVFSMTVRFVPEFMIRLRKIRDAQKYIGKEVSHGSIKKRIKSGLSILSAMTSWSLEGSIDTADSMKARGYGTGKRTSFSLFRFSHRDGMLLFLIAACTVLIIYSKLCGVIECSYFPVMRWNTGWLAVLTFVIYFIFSVFPVIFEIAEVIRWKRL